MNSKFSHPALILAALGAVSGVLGTIALGFGVGEAPHPGIHMILTGVWFGLVVGYGVWRWGGRSRLAAAIAVAGTWVAWELAVNLAMQLDSNWLKPIALSEALKPYLSGFAAGAVGAFVTWAGAAWLTPALRQMVPAVAIVVVGALFGLLMPLTNNYDTPAILLLPWQAAIAAALGFFLTLQQGSWTEKTKPLATP